MTRIRASLTLAALLCAAAQAATISTTITVNAKATLAGTSFNLTGTTNMTGGIGAGTLASTISLGALSGTNAVADYTITVTSGGTITGKLTVPVSVLTGGATSSASVQMTVTGGTGAYSGATSGSTPITLTGSVSGDITSGFNLNNFTGSGTITTGGSSGGPTPPSISVLQNNYSNVLPGFPNYGIAPSTLFIIKGSNLANTSTDLQSSASPGLQTTLQNVSVTVTAGGKTYPCPLYYVLPTQIAAVLPGTVPTGPATATVTNNGTVSATYQFTVVQSAFGILSYNGSLAAAYDANNNIITANNAANPGQAIILWGSGVGADPKDDDKLFPQAQDDLSNIPMTVYIGGVQANIAYRGRSQFPGLDQVVVTVPGNAPTGCFVSVSVVSGNPATVSNSATMPIASSGKTCSDANGGITPDVFNSLAGKSTVKLGVLSISQATSISGATSQTSSSVGGFFQSLTGFATSSTAGGTVSIGSCLVTTSTSGTGSTGTSTGLDAGSKIAVTGPAGNLSLQPFSSPFVTLAGFYSTADGTVPSGFLPSSGGTFTFDNSTGGKDVGHFNTTLVVPPAFTWTNSSSITSVNRSQGVNVTWSGGAPGSYVDITGGSSATINGQLYAFGFVCIAPVAAGQFTVPSNVLLALPAGNNGNLSVGDYTASSTFTASGLDLGLTSAGSVTSKLLAYQ